MQPNNPDNPYGDQPPSYGQQPPGYGPPPGGGSFGPPAGGTQGNIFGLLALILGIAAIPLLCCFYIGVLPGIAAAVLGYIGKQRVAQGQANNRGMAQAGFILGIVAVALGVVLFIIGVIAQVNLPTYGG
jgi:hypothetical protein